MRILKSNYWSNFRKKIIYKDGRTKTIKDGKKFEELIKRILDLEYGEGNWKDTGATWDGSRDFEWHTSDFYKWAECKNYSSNIALNVISNTLIMAMIDFADEILIFSYSKINRETINKLIRFADVSQKILRIYADDSLEEIILKYMHNLKDDFFPNFQFNDSGRILRNPYIECNIVADPVTAYTLSNEVTIDEKPSKINFDTLLCINTLLYNPLSKDITVRIQIDWTKSEHCFKALNQNNAEDIVITIPSYSTLINKVFFSPIKYNTKLFFPELSVSVYHNTKKFSFGYTQCSWIGECSLIGSSYKTIKHNFSNRVLLPNYFFGFNLIGNSGVGKSRLLKECENVAIGKGFRVIRFLLEKYSYQTEYNNHSKKALEQKLILEFFCTVFDVPNIEGDLMDRSNSNNIYRIIQMLRSGDVDKNYIHQHIVPAVINKLSETKCYISIDNVQYFPDFFLSFIYDIAETLILSNKHCKSRIGFSFNTDYIHQQNECMRLFMLLKTNKYRIYSESIGGFSTEGEAKSFINQLLSAESIDNNLIDNIIAVTEHNPFYIKSYINQFESEGLLIKRDDSFLVPKHMYDLFKEKVLSIPKNITESLEERWQIFLQEYSEEKCLEIISLLHILQFLKEDQILFFDLEPSLVNSLLQFNFIKQTDLSEKQYCFEHDLTEKFFSDKYFPLCGIYFKKNTTPQFSHFWYSRIREIFLAQLTDIISYKKILEKDPPYKLGLEIYHILIEAIIQNISSVTEIRNCLSIIISTCQNTRERFGTEKSIALYNKIVNLIENGYPEFQSEGDWVWIMQSYCNYLYEQNKFHDAIEHMETLLKYWPENKITKANIIFYGYIYNRLHVYNRALDQEPNYKSLDWLELSEEIQETYNNAEIKFINLIDRGYCNYNNILSKQKVTTYWKDACDVYENNKISSKKMNYIYAKILLGLLDNNQNDAEKFIKIGLRTINLKDKDAYYFTYFKQRYLLCSIACNLMKYNRDNKQSIENKFNEIEDCNLFLKGRSSVATYWLKSIFLFYSGQYLDSILCIQSTIEKLLLSKKLTFRDIFLEQLYDNAKWFIINSRISVQEIENSDTVLESKLESVIRQALQLSEHKRKEQIKCHTATSILQGYDRKVNFPTL